MNITMFISMFVYINEVDGRGVSKFGKYKLGVKIIKKKWGGGGKCGKTSGIKNCGKKGVNCHYAIMSRWMPLCPGEMNRRP